MQEFRKEMNFLTINYMNESICSNDPQDAMYFLSDRATIIKINNLIKKISKPTTLLEHRFVKDIRNNNWNIDVSKEGYLSIILSCKKRLDILTYDDYIKFFNEEGTIKYKYFETKKEAKKYVKNSFEDTAIKEQFILLDEKEYFNIYKKEIENSIYLGFSLHDYMSEYLYSISKMIVEGLIKEYDYLCEFGKTNIENEMRMLVIEKLIEKNNKFEFDN